MSRGDPIHIVIIIPTYNEIDNITRLIDRLALVFQRVRHTMSILVVDDLSPDGTEAAVRIAMQKYSFVHLISGRKEGLGRAYIRGMLHAMDMGADAVFEMDADFSHDPDDVPRLIASLEQGFDFIIGSRYVKGGSIPKEWSLLRKLNSYFGNIVARYVAGMRSVSDCTAGFRCIRTKLLRDIDLKTIQTQGYGFQVSLLYAALACKARIKEVPVQFIDRTQGDSKLGLRDILEFVIQASAIRLAGMQTFIRFCLVGASGVLINIAMLHLLSSSLQWHRYLASAIAFETSILWNFTLNYNWTFAAHKMQAGIKLQGLKFNIVSLISLCFGLASFIGVNSSMPQMSVYQVQLCSIVPMTAINYFLNSYWTFGSSKGRED